MGVRGWEYVTHCLRRRRPGSDAFTVLNHHQPYYPVLDRSSMVSLLVSRVSTSWGPKSCSGGNSPVSCQLSTGSNLQQGLPSNMTLFGSAYLVRITCSRSESTSGRETPVRRRRHRCKRGDMKLNLRDLPLIITNKQRSYGTARGPLSLGKTAATAVRDSCLSTVPD